MRRVLAILLLVLAAGVAQAQTVRFPSVAVGSVAAGPELTAGLYRPAGVGPFPAIVLAHPCSGVSDHTAVWGRLLASWGYVTLAPDSFKPRSRNTRSSVSFAGVFTSHSRAALMRVSIFSLSTFAP